MRTIHRGALAIACATLGYAGTSHAAIYKVGPVGPGSSCTHSTIQAAVDAAAANPGRDYIRVTRSYAKKTLNYLAQQIRIPAQDLQIEGGWETCDSATAGTNRTTVSGAGGNAAPVFWIDGRFGPNAYVTLAGLDVVGGEQSGIRFEAKGSLTLLSVRVGDNASPTYGGGIDFAAPAGSRPDSATLIVGNDTVIEKNSAVLGGGGIACRTAWLTMYAARSRISENTTGGDGGGLYAADCGAGIGSSAAYPTMGVFWSNHASGNGGAIEATVRSNVSVETIDANAPTLVNGNTADGIGGAIDVRMGSDMYLRGAIVDGNRGYQGGGAVAVVDTGDGPALSVSDSGSVSCAAGIICGRFSNNIARSASGLNQHGAALLYSVDWRSDGVRDIDARNASFIGNIGETLVRAESHYGAAAPHLFFGGVVMNNNWTNSDLLQFVTSGQVAAPDAGFEITGSSIAQNTIRGAVYRGTTDLRMTGSIAWQPERQPVFSFTAGAPAVGRVAQVMVSDAIGMPADPSIVLADPRFVDASHGNLRLRSDSPALDFTSFHALATDRDGRPRTVDLFLPSNRYGATDLGAYELQQDSSGSIGP